MAQRPPRREEPRRDRCLGSCGGGAGRCWGARERRVVWPPARGARWTTQAPAPWAGVGGRDMMGMMLIWPVLLLVLGALLVAGVVWAVQLSSRGGSHSG